MLRIGSKGFSLVEVVVAMAASGFLAMGLLSMLLNGFDGVQSAQKRMAAVELQTFITQTLNNPSICNQSFVGKQVPVVNQKVPTLTFANLKMDDTSNSHFENNQLTITSMTYKSVKQSGNTFSANVEVNVSLQSNSKQNVVGGNTLPPMDFPLVVTGSGGIITACGSTGGSTQSAISGPSCVTPHSGGGTCTTTVTWPNAFPDNNYSVSCNLLGPISDYTGCGFPGGCIWIASVNRAPGSVTVTVATGTNNQAQSEQAAGISCVGIHN